MYYLSLLIAPTLLAEASRHPRVVDHHEGRQLNTTGVKGKSLEEVYGSVSKVDGMQPWHERSPIRAARSDKYFELRQPDACVFPIEVYLVQDLTASFQDHVDNMHNTQLPRLVEAMSRSHPHSSYGVASFRDKPIWTLGDPETDYCLVFEAPLSADPAGMFEVYADMYSTGGGDPAENSFGALWATAQSETPGWSNAEASRLFVLVTDAPPHFNGDGFQNPSYGLTAPSDVFDEANSDRQCREEYYPDADMVAQALRSREAYVAFLIYDAEWWDSRPIESWRWFNRYIEQPDQFVAAIGDAAEGFWTELAKIIQQIEDVECGVRTTSEPNEITTTETETTTTEAETTTTEAETTTTEAKTLSSATTEISTMPESTTIPVPTTTTGEETYATSEPKASLEGSASLLEETHTTMTLQTGETTDACCPACPCPEVHIRLRERPRNMKLTIDNVTVDI